MTCSQALAGLCGSPRIRDPQFTDGPGWLSWEEREGSESSGWEYEGPSKASAFLPAGD